MGSAKIICEIYKLEAQYLGSNCSFDGGHLCGWANSIVDQNGDYDLSQDVDTFNGIAQPWYNEDYFNGPIWDWNRGSKLKSHFIPLNKCKFFFTTIRYKRIIRLVPRSCWNLHSILGLLFTTHAWRWQNPMCDH